MIGLLIIALHRLERSVSKETCCVLRRVEAGNSLCLSGYFRAEGYKSRHHKSWSMEKIQEVYGSKLVQDEQQKIARCA